MKDLRVDVKQGERWENQMGEATEERGRAPETNGSRHQPSSCPRAGKGRTHTQGSSQPCSQGADIPRWLTVQSGSGHQATPRSLQFLQCQSPASPSWEPLLPLTLFAGPDLPSCLRGSPEQTDSCHKHSPWVIKRYLQGSSCSPIPRPPSSADKRGNGGGRTGTREVRRERSQVQRLPAPLLNVLWWPTIPTVRTRTPPCPHQAQTAEALPPERWDTAVTETQMQGLNPSLALAL